jgi:hypothetical protein
MDKFPISLRSAVALALLGSGATLYSPNAAALTAYALGGNALIEFDTSQPASANAARPITGLIAGDQLVAIDVRPQNGYLYGLGYNPTAGTVQIYAISQRSALATAIGTAVSFVDAGGAPQRVGVDANTRFGMDFNPTVDRIRVVTDNGQNFRLNPNTGAAIDANAGAAGVQMDGALNGAATRVDATAYTNNAQNATVTTQYAIDAASDTLYIQNPPNNGTLGSAQALTLAGAALAIDGANGFDIAPGVNTMTGGMPVASGSGFLLATVGGVTQLYGVDLVTGNATALGVLGGGSSAVQGLAVHAESSPGSLPAFALREDGAQLLRFATATPGTSVAVNIAGVGAGEVLVGFDLRPATGQLYGLGVNAAADTATLYLIDPQVASVTAIGTPGSIAYVDALGAPIDLPVAAGGYGLDFNPQVDRLRITTGSGLNLRINPITGTAIDGDAGTAGVNPDGAINGLPGGSTGISAVAYTNAFGGAAATTQYTIDAASGTLFIQNPPNAGTQTQPQLINTVSGALIFGAVSGFDIPPAVRVASGGSAAEGSGFAILGQSGVIVVGGSNFYRINLADGFATALGNVGSGEVFAGLAIGDGPQPNGVLSDGFEDPPPTP